MAKQKEFQADKVAEAATLFFSFLGHSIVNFLSRGQVVEMGQSDLMDRQEVADYLRYDDPKSVDRLRNNREDNGFPVPIMLGNSPRWKRKELCRWLETKKSE